MYNILTLIFLCVFSVVIVETANQDNSPHDTTDCDDKYNYSGMAMGSGYYAYPIRQEDCGLMEFLRDLYAPVEMLIKCNNLSLSQRIKEYRKFVQRFPRIETQNDAIQSKKHLCQDRGGHMVQPLYATDVCEFEQFVFYLKKGETIIQETIITDFYDQPISNVKKFYDEIDADMDRFNDEQKNITDIGCDNEDIRSNQCYSRLRVLPFPNTGELIMLSRIHCCCKYLNCTKLQRSTQTTRFCITGSNLYTFENGEIKLNGSNPWSTDIYTLDQLILDTACYTAINVSKKRTGTSDFIAVTLSHSVRVDSDMRSELSSFTQTTRTVCKMVVKNGINVIVNDIYMVCRENVRESANNTVYFTHDPSTHILQTSKTIFDLLFEMTKNKWTLSKDMSLLLDHCFFHYKQPSPETQGYCNFFYDSVQRKQLNIVEGTNFIFMDPNLHKLKIRELLEQNSTDICVSTGGCEIQKGSARSCDNIERFVLVCFCRSEERYCDYDLMEKLKEDKNWTNLEYYVPFCDVGNYNINDSFNFPKPANSTSQFFCFEEVTDTEDGWKKAHEMVFPAGRVGFFNHSEHGNLVENEKLCLKHDLSALFYNGFSSQCGNVGNRYFYCCQATLHSRNKNISSYMRQNYTCNTGKEVNECYTIAQHQRLTNPANISSTLKERNLCEVEVSDVSRLPMSMWGLGFTTQPMCYFTIPLGQAVPNKIDSYYYDRYNPKGDNRGIFSILCDQRKWTVNERIRGYACRLISTPMPISIQRDASELSCCCVAHLVQKYKQLILDDREKFIQKQNSVLRMDDE
ncbi:hypothetical protein DdX_17738 [Ditylenchus destructor]|uniref:Uncharacterized protein n=1 Tax=Ditylenchus destructor TaxID=166010 RepID=A0AAD4MQT7_9BILA|nr:hypothetical protein DdX_17738 [Ditylenchus destructor]